MNVIRKWFGYRKNDPAGRRSSPLDDRNADHWAPRCTTELLELISVLEMCIDIEPRQAHVLVWICDGPLITGADLKQERVFQCLSASENPLPPESPNMPTLL